jgi:hypothetical protein
VETRCAHFELPFCFPLSLLLVTLLDFRVLFVVVLLLLEEVLVGAEGVEAVGGGGDTGGGSAGGCDNEVCRHVSVGDD